MSAVRRVAIVDYGMGNTDSVRRAVEECGGKPVVTSIPHDFERADHIILPGVGAFGEGMRNIRERGLDEVLSEQVLSQGVPFLGVCLGMHLLATVGHEGGETPGLGWISGAVMRLEATSPKERIPHMGWNEVEHSGASALFSGISSGKDFYFVHSFHLAPTDPSTAIGSTPYCGGFVSAIARDNIFGVQFHPEKSQRVGLQLIANFLTLT